MKYRSNRAVSWQVSMGQSRPRLKSRARPHKQTNEHNRRVNTLRDWARKVLVAAVVACGLVMFVAGRNSSRFTAIGCTRSRALDGSECER